MTDIHEAIANPEANGPGYDAQTRPTGQPVAVNRTDSYGSAEHIPVAMTTDQLEDAKLGRALREGDMTPEDMEARAGRLLAMAARARAERLGPCDAHEMRHLLAAIEAGNSDNCDGGRACTLDLTAARRAPGGRPMTDIEQALAEALHDTSDDGCRGPYAECDIRKSFLSEAAAILATPQMQAIARTAESLANEAREAENAAAVYKAKRDVARADRDDAWRRALAARDRYEKAEADADRLAEALEECINELDVWVTRWMEANPVRLANGYNPYQHKPSLAIGIGDWQEALRAHDEATR